MQTAGTNTNSNNSNSLQFVYPLLNYASASMFGNVSEKEIYCNYVHDIL